jgi:hypothetical protein
VAPRLDLEKKAEIAGDRKKKIMGMGKWKWKCK